MFQTHGGGAPVNPPPEGMVWINTGAMPIPKVKWGFTGAVPPYLVIVIIHIFIFCIKFLLFLSLLFFQL